MVQSKAKRWSQTEFFFQNGLSLVVQKHSYKLDCKDRFLALKHSSQTVSYVCCSKTLLVHSHTDFLQEKYEKLLEQFANLSGE